MNFFGFGKKQQPQQQQQKSQEVFGFRTTAPVQRTSPYGQQAQAQQPIQRAQQQAQTQQPIQRTIQPSGGRPDAQSVQDEEPILVKNEEKGKKISVDMPEMTIDGLLKKMKEIKASDLHFETSSPPIYRINGDIVFTDLPRITQQTAEGLLMPLLSESQKGILNNTGNIDFCYEIPGTARFRANYLRHRGGLGAVFRIIPSKIPTAEELKLPEVIKTIANYRKGIILVTGPTGSGKTTTMAAIINYINNNRKAHIITIEDPIEFSHTPVNCLISHREVRQHAKSFSTALKAALREDPDVILVGELRDLETISLALTAAQMGVLVMGTLHTNSATKTIDRMIDVFPPKQQEQARIQLSQSLRAIIAQQLLKRADGSGRIAAMEILISDLSLANIIREGKTPQIPTYITMGKSRGMQFMDNVLIEYVKNKIITKEEAILRMKDPKLFERAGITIS